MPSAALIAAVAFLTGVACVALVWGIPYVRRTRQQLRRMGELDRRVQEEQSRAAYLSFLNNVSKAAITSKRPGDLLNQAVDEVQRTFGFDHVSIALADYARKELEVRAEAGLDKYRLGIGKRVALEAGVLGITSQQNELRTISSEGESSAIEAAQSVLCHPITYGETLLGILTVESFTREKFSQEEVLTLGTLADLLATALHNAMTFEELEYQSITDCLTGIKTRRYFLESIHAEWNRASRANRPFSLVLIDLDKFKHVNDSLGHLDGDLVLARVGRLLEQKSRHSNVVARYGGDEFVILMPDTNMEQAKVLAERLRGWLAGDALLSERGVTGSFGVASFPINATTIDEIIRQADDAMYESKVAGGNRVSVAGSPSPERRGGEALRQSIER